jgi:propanol-preferring alcohol dehydrogenase
MRAVILPGDGTVGVVGRPDPKPGDGEVVVRVRASAICRSDMSLYRGTPIVGSRQEQEPVIPGHEVAGEVVATGPGAGDLREGDRVACHLAIGCGHCQQCFAGYWMLCPRWRCLGFDVDGGNAEYMAVPARNCLPLPETVSYLGGSVLTDMVGTQFHLQRETGVHGGSTLVVIGLGPMGCAGVMVASALGATVVGVDPLAGRQERAVRLGAAAVVAPGELAGLLGAGLLGDGADVAVDCSGSEAGQNAALDCVRQRADVVLVGERTATTIDPSNQIIRKLTRVRGGWYFPRWRYEELAAFTVARDLPLESLVSTTTGLEDAAEAFRAFDARETEKSVFVL